MRTLFFIDINDIKDMDGFIKAMGNPKYRDKPDIVKRWLNIKKIPFTIVELEDVNKLQKESN